jgi:hypothetical protein
MFFMFFNFLHVFQLFSCFSTFFMFFNFFRFFNIPSDFQSYDFTIFNFSMISQKRLVGSKIWRHLHPLYRSWRFEWLSQISLRPHRSKFSNSLWFSTLWFHHYHSFDDISKTVGRKKNWSYLPPLYRSWRFEWWSQILLGPHRFKISIPYGFQPYDFMIFTFSMISQKRLLEKKIWSYLRRVYRIWRFEWWFQILSGPHRSSWTQT